MSQPGLRERNKMRRREAIVAAALRLFADRGYDETTIAEIAEVAEVAPRTVLTHFATKEDIAMAPVDALAERMTTALRSRAPGKTTLDVVAPWLQAEMRYAESGPADHELKRRMFENNPRLEGQAMARVAGVAAEYTHALAADMGRDPDDPATGIVVAGAAGIISHILSLSTDSDRDGAVRDALAFLEGGVAALSRRPA
jgi:AcrR family transcriptional regulator